MGTVAKRSVSGVFALTQEGIAVFFGNEHFRGKVGAFVRAIAEWLIDRISAGAEEIFLSLFESDFSRGFGGNVGF